MKHPANRIATSAQATPGVEGYVFDGVEGSQMAFWTCGQTAVSVAHVHDYDEYMIVVQGRYTLIIDGQRIPLNAGDRQGNDSFRRGCCWNPDHPCFWRPSGRPGRLLIP
jgi:quercetin dioxygenase-like cupin family protein